MLNFRAIALAATLAVSGAAVAIAPTASAKGGPGAVKVSGLCTKSSSSKLKLSQDNGRVEVEFEVDQNRNGIPWKVTLRRNGSLVTSTTTTTRAPSGSFSVHRLISGAKGTFVAVATRSGERCSAHASI
jgi:hypothetical protein